MFEGRALRGLRCVRGGADGVIEPWKRCFPRAFRCSVRCSTMVKTAFADKGRLLVRRKEGIMANEETKDGARRGQGAEVLRHTQDMANDVRRHAPEAADDVRRHVYNMAGDVKRHMDGMPDEVTRHSQQAAEEVRREMPLIVAHVKETMGSLFGRSKQDAERKDAR